MYINFKMKTLGGEQKVRYSIHKNLSGVVCLPSGVNLSSHISFSSVNFLHDDNLNSMRG